MRNTTKRKLAGGAAVLAGVGLGTVVGAMVGAPSVSGAVTDPVAQEAAPFPGEGRPFGHHRGPGWGHHRGERLEAAAEALGMDVEELRQALRDGQTLAEVAEAQGVELETLVGALVADANARLDEAVAEGRISEERAATIREGIEERVTAMVNGEGPLRERFCDPADAAEDGTENGS